MLNMNERNKKVRIILWDHQLIQLVLLAFQLVLAPESQTELTQKVFYYKVEYTIRQSIKLKIFFEICLVSFCAFTFWLSGPPDISSLTPPSC